MTHTFRAGANMASGGQRSVPTRLAPGDPVYNHALEFLYAEAELLDENRQVEWLAMLGPSSPMPRQLSSSATRTFLPTNTSSALIVRCMPIGPCRLTSIACFTSPSCLFGFIAAITDLELVTGVLNLPQRQTALVAKQAAEVDLLSSGRLRLGIGLGRKAVEYEALGKNFRDRGVRSEEQVTLLRRLSTEQTVTHEGVSERVIGAGLAPAPIQRPIPIWFGGTSVPAYRRAGRLGDGLFPVVPPGPELDKAKSIVEAAAVEPGRDPGTLGMHAQASWGPGGVETIAEQAALWCDAGPTHLSINTMNAGFASVDEHLAALAVAADVFELS